MPLHKISDFDAEYHTTVQGEDIKGMNVHSQGNGEKIGSVSDILVDEQGKFRYLIVDLGLWIFGKKVLLPIGRTRTDSGANQILVNMTKEQAENLPEYKEGMPLDYDYEEQVRGVHRTRPLDAASTAVGNVTSPTYNRDTYNYEQDRDLYDVSDHEDQTFKLYEERLVANKQRQKTGEVKIGKHVETDTARVAVPLEKERVIIERVTPTDAGQAVAPGVANFREGEVARLEIHEEVPDIRKEAFVREEVRVTKVTEQETVEAQETIRREELDVNTDGRPVIDKPNSI
ncbi:MAG: DUF2382 domain-containing protein [Rhizonema sp. NSF051]|nr:DUF2382 domain-containing protein [Rhizonema sp. NSF051]